MTPKKIVLGVIGLAIALFALRSLVFRQETISITPTDEKTTGEQYLDPATTTDSFSILFGGDIFLDRSIRRTIEKHGIDYLWRDITPLLEQYEYKVANLEGPVVYTPEAARSYSFEFAFQPEYVQKLKDLHFTAVSLANNHTLNKGSAGLASTRKALDAMGLPYFGDPDNVASRASLLREINGRKIAFVGEHDLIKSGQGDILALITRLKKEGNIVIVYPHWGAEYITEIPSDEQFRAHALIDAGADLIFGSHPHVIQPIELYKGKLIFYSLGNFLFDQYFSFDTLHGLLVGVEFAGKGSEVAQLAITLLPTEQDTTYQIHQATGTVRSALLKRIAEDSSVPEDIKGGIAAGAFTIPF